MWKGWWMQDVYDALHKHALNCLHKIEENFIFSSLFFVHSPFPPLLCRYHHQLPPPPSPSSSSSYDISGRNNDNECKMLMMNCITMRWIVCQKNWRKFCFLVSFLCPLSLSTSAVSSSSSPSPSSYDTSGRNDDNEWKMLLIYCITMRWIVCKKLKKILFSLSLSFVHSPFPPPLYRHHHRHHHHQGWHQGKPLRGRNKLGRSRGSALPGGGPGDRAPWLGSGWSPLKLMPF